MGVAMGALLHPLVVWMLLVLACVCVLQLPLPGAAADGGARACLAEWLWWALDFDLLREFRRVFFDVPLGVTVTPYSNTLNKLY